MTKLTLTQARVFKHMPAGQWLSAYDLQASMATLNALHKKGFIRRRGVGTLGSSYSPRTTLEYYKPVSNEQEK